MSIYSPKGIEGGILVSGSADHEIRSNRSLYNISIDWHLVKKKISSKINVQRPDEEFLLRYKDQQTPLVNFAEDHILNTVLNPSIIFYSQKPLQSSST